jgi:hypothetical protein
MSISPRKESIWRAAGRDPACVSTTGTIPEQIHESQNDGISFYNPQPQFPVGESEATRLVRSMAEEELQQQKEEEQQEEGARDVINAVNPERNEFMNTAQQNQMVADAILRAAHRQKPHSHSSPPQVATQQTREDIPTDLLEQIKVEGSGQNASGSWRPIEAVISLSLLSRRSSLNSFRHSSSCHFAADHNPTAPAFACRLSLVAIHSGIVVKAVPGCRLSLASAGIRLFLSRR